MNKQELVDAAAKRLGVTKAKAGDIADLFFGAEGLIASELKRGAKVSITGFGSFEIRTRAAREGRNPRTGKTIAIQASTVPAFRPARSLKDLVNRKR